MGLRDFRGAAEQGLICLEQQPRDRDALGTLKQAAVDVALAVPLVVAALRKLGDEDRVSALKANELSVGMPRANSLAC